MRFRRRSALALALVGVLAGGVVAGCGDDSDDSGAAGTDTATTAQTSDGGGVAEAQELVAAAEKTTGLEFPQPDEPFDPGAGKLAVISCGQAGINCKRGADFVVEAAKTMGWTTSPVFDGEFAPATQSGFIQQAVQEGYDAIVLVAVDAQVTKAAIDAAAAQDIPIACMECVSTGFEDKVIDVTTGGEQEGDQLGAWVVADTEGEGKILQFDDKNFPIIGVRQQAAKAEIERLCPDCEISEDNYPTTDLAKPDQPTYTAALTSNPPGSLTTIMTPSDPEGMPLVKLATQQGRDDFSVTGYDASAEFVQDIIAGDTVAAATTAVPYEFVAWGAVDQVARAKAGIEGWDSSAVPSVLVTANNADEFESGFWNPSDFDYKAMFEEQWSGS